MTYLKKIIIFPNNKLASMLWLLLRINQLLKLNRETQCGNWEVLVWNWRVLLQYIGRCPYICWKCQDTRRQNAQVFHLRTTIHWPDATGALQHKAQHQKPQSMCPAPCTWAEVYLLPELQVAPLMKDMSVLPPYHSHVMTLSLITYVDTPGTTSRPACITNPGQCFYQGVTFEMVQQSHWLLPYI